MGRRTYVGGSSRDEIYYLRRRRRRSDLALVPDMGLPTLVREDPLRPYDDQDNHADGALSHGVKGNTVWEFDGTAGSMVDLMIKMPDPDTVELWERNEVKDPDDLLWGQGNPTGGDVGDVYIRVVDDHTIEVWENQ